MHGQDALDHLLAVLRERRIPLTRDDVQWAFESVKTHDDIVAWVEEHLQPNTLLSKEELDLYATISGNDEKAKDSADLLEVLPIQDEDIRAAIDALESSTAAIDQQTKALEVQMDALLELRTQNSETSNGVRRKVDDRKKKHAQEKHQLDFAVEGLIDGINERLTSAQKQTKAAGSSLSTTTNDRLTSDDRLLSALTKLAPKLETSDEDQFEPETIDNWCTSLISLRAAGIRTRVDRVFHEALLQSTTTNTSRPEEDALAEKAALKEELETLHAEISSVAQMSVEQELRAPIQQALEQGQGARRRAQARVLDYMLCALEYMTSRLRFLGAHANDVRAHTAALAEISELFTAALPPPPAPRPSPLKPAGSGGARARAKSSAARDSQQQQQQQTLVLSAATQQLLRQLDISLPPALASSSTAGARQALAEAALERRGRLLAHMQSAEKSTVDGVRDTLWGGAVEVQELLAALFAHSAFRTATLTRREVEERVEGLERAIGEVSGCMGEVQQRLDVGGAEGSRGKRRERAFVGRWGRE